MLQAITLRPLHVRSSPGLYSPIVRTMRKNELFYVADEPIIEGAFYWRRHITPDGRLLDRYSAEKYTGGSGIEYVRLKPFAHQKVMITLPMSVGEIVKIHDLRMVYNKSGDWMISYSVDFAMVTEAV